MSDGQSNSVQKSGKPNWANKTLFVGDNLPIMRRMNGNSVDLIYLDPPFNSNANYAAPIGSPAAGAEFKDTWTLSEIDIEWLDLLEAKHPALNRVIHAAMTDSDKSYLIYMAVRLLEMHRILKPGGSIFLHCDPTMSHYLKLAMDVIFGRSRFQSEITWKRTSAHNDRVFSSVADKILFYGDSHQRRDELFVQQNPEHIEEDYEHSDSRGRYKTDTLTGFKHPVGESGQAWQGIDPTLKYRCWTVPKRGEYAEWIENHYIPNYRQIKGIHDRLDALNEAGFIHFPKSSGGLPQLKHYLMSDADVFPTNIWTDIPPVTSWAKERSGYPTQKPIKLLNRIIQAVSKEGDIVFDPFCGCGTTCVSAETLNLQRQWVAIDISQKAGELVERRIRDIQGLFEEIVVRTDLPQRTDLGKLPKYNSPDNKTKLYGEQGGYCNGCGTHFELRHLQVHHVIAKKKGGTDHIENLQLLCGNCNLVKGDRGMEYLMNRLKS